VGKQNSFEKKPFGFGNIVHRFPQTGMRVECKIAKGRFVFDHAIQGHDCQKIRESGDFVVQKRYFFSITKLENPQLMTRRKETQ